MKSQLIKCIQGKMTVDEMTEDKMIVDEMMANEMSFRQNNSRLID